MLTGSNQKVSDQERGSNVPLRRRCITGVRAEPKLLKVVFMWNVETPYDSGSFFLGTGKRVARRADSDAGLGGWTKQMPFCNETNTG